jgi:hypothetical protein
MPLIRLLVKPRFCGPASVGTVSVVQLIREYCNLDLAGAKEIVDRAVFQGEQVEISVSDLATAKRLATALRKLPTPPSITVEVCDPGS